MATPRAGDSRLMGKPGSVQAAEFDDVQAADDDDENQNGDDGGHGESPTALQALAGRPNLRKTPVMPRARRYTEAWFGAVVLNPC